MSIVTKPEEKLELTQEELTTLREIQQQTQNLILQLGEISLTRINLETQYKKIKENLVTLKEEEVNYSKTLGEKYGNITLNPTTGDIALVE